MTFVDADVHEALANGPLDLLPYVDEPVRSWFSNGPLTTPQSHYLHPVSPVLEEARTEEQAGGPKALLRLKAPTAATDYPSLAAGLLDRYEPRFVVLTGTFHPSSFNLQPEGAVALARAYNSWLIENWLDRDERLLGTIHVAVHDVDAEWRRSSAAPTIRGWCR
jgi:predicted TIM-barrel fold metal-dependent hydrolase